MATQRLTFAAAVDGHGHGDYRGDADDPAALADLEIGRVQPDVRPLTVQRAVQELADPLVDVFAQLGDGALRDAAQPHRLHQLVDSPGRDPADPGFLDHCDQGLLRGSARLQKAGEVRPLPELGDAQV